MVLSAATAAKWHPRHLRIVKQVHRRKLRSILHIGQFPRFCPSSTSGQPQYCYSAVLFNRHPPFSTQQASAFFNSRAYVRWWPLAIVWPCLFFTNRRIVLPTSKEVIHHPKRTPVRGHVGSREAISQPGKARVASDQALSGRQGVVAHDRFAQANLSAQAVR